MKLRLEEGGICSIIGGISGGKSCLLAYICRQIINKDKVKQKIAYIYSNQLEGIGFFRNKVDFYERKKYILSSDIARNRFLIVSGEKSIIEEKHLSLIDYVDCIDFNNIRSIDELEFLINKLIDHGYKNILMDDFHYLISVCAESYENNERVWSNRILRKLAKIIIGKISVYITVQAQRGSIGSSGIDRAMSEMCFSTKVLDVSVDKGCMKITLLKDRSGQVNQAMYIPINKNFSFGDRVNG